MYVTVFLQDTVELANATVTGSCAKTTSFIELSAQAQGILTSGHLKLSFEREVSTSMPLNAIKGVFIISCICISINYYNNWNTPDTSRDTLCMATCIQFHTHFLSSPIFGKYALVLFVKSVCLPVSQTSIS